MNIFATLPAGDSATWLDDPVTLPDGRVADATSWALTYYLRGPSTLDLVATAVAARWQTVLTAAASAALLDGLYGWTAIITKGTERITLATSQLTLTPDVTQATTGFDTRTVAQKALAACEAAMATFNTTGGKVRKYEIAGRSMEFQSIGDLMQLHAFWKAKVQAEGAAASIAQGQGNPRNLYIRHRRPD